MSRPAYAKPVRLELNNSGAWNVLGRFDAADDDQVALVLDAAEATWSDEGAQITRRGAFSCQACIPAQWTDEQAKAFADRENLCGTTNGWFLRKQGDPALSGCDERVPCESRGPGFVHVMFDA